MQEILRHDSLRMMAKAGAIKSVQIIGQGDGFALVMTPKTGEEMPLITKRGDLRRFKKLETVLAYLKEDCGVGEATLKFEFWHKKQGDLAL